MGSRRKLGVKPAKEHFKDGEKIAKFNVTPQAIWPIAFPS
jgi:hypothetical protein